MHFLFRGFFSFSRSKAYFYCRSFRDIPAILQAFDDPQQGQHSIRQAAKVVCSYHSNTSRFKHSNLQELFLLCFAFLFLDFILTIRIGVRYLPTPASQSSQSTQVDPKEKAQSIVNAMPGKTWISKTGILATGAAASIYAISNELLIMHSELILVVTFSSFIALCGKFVAPLYNEWAEGEIKRVKNILNESRRKHVVAVKDRIESVSQLKDVVSTTKQLFGVSKETAKLEAESFELKQRIAVASEAKATLDAWVRYEQQQRQLEQEQLVQSVLEKVNKEIANPKFQERVLAESVAEVEKIFALA